MEKQGLKEKLSGQTLYKLAHASETAENVCLALGTRERIRDFSNINSLKYELRHQGFKIVEADYMKMWKDWQTAGLGTIEFGRGKKQTKFVHFYDMRKIASAAIDGKDVEVMARNKEQKVAVSADRSLQLDRIAKSISETKVENAKVMETIKKSVPAPKAVLPAVGVNRIIVSLRSNLVVDFSIPQDITPAEVDRIREALNRVAPAGAYSAA